MKPSEARNKLKYEYYDFEREDTSKKRSYNIKQLITLIKKEKEKDDLEYDSNERFIVLFETEEGEKIGLQFPGKESKQSEKDTERKPNIYDTKPILITKHGEVLPNLSFNTLYKTIENMYDINKSLSMCLLTLIFRIGYMIELKKVTRDFPIYNIYKNDYSAIKNNSFHAETVSLYLMDYNNEVVRYLSSQYEKIAISKKEEKEKMYISLPALMSYFELLFQQEDIKYNYTKVLNNKVINYGAPGRISTAKSCILFGGLLQNKVNVADTLQSFIRGRGIGMCDDKKIVIYTNKYITMFNAKDEVTKKLDEKNVKYRVNGSVKKIKGIKFKINETVYLLVKKKEYMEYEQRKNDFKGINVYCYEDKTFLKNLSKNH